MSDVKTTYKFSMDGNKCGQRKRKSAGSIYRKGNGIRENISEKLKLRPPETEFERDITSFGHFLMEVTLLIVMTIFAINVYLQHPILDSFLFSLTLTFGLIPQVLPAIININLSRGAREMAQKKVIVRRLASIENLGSTNMLCSNKTGTLTSSSRFRA
ncbi:MULTISPECIES: hypothetical protein [unclassified Methanosarcina]|uniref:P-type ATPase n=1 Tax=unclassified Methanosarcina TaxID=2644672 RepID=UPI000615B58D|nr:MULTISPECIES: hypothetical protein [unclassified Methanosarcina]AKB18420.1 Mg(2+) transport ATPase, P-type [Methanosarcina sp. WWM596]